MKGIKNPTYSSVNCAIKPTAGVVCVHCEWLAEYRCAADGELVCGKHRSPHYGHRVIAKEEN